jgi:hypothetical protein
MVTLLLTDSTELMTGGVELATGGGLIIQPYEERAYDHQLEGHL